MRNFKHTMDVLIKAYLNNTLQHVSCHACAVGNIVGGSAWSSWFCTSAQGKQYTGGIIVTDQSRRIKGFYQIQESGYTKAELMKIEYAFETADKGKNGDDYMFNGLVAVLQVLAEIHSVDIGEKQDYHTQLEDILTMKELCPA